MRLRPIVLVLIALGVLATPVPPAAGQVTPGEPVLRSDSAFEATEWGYKLESLEFPATNPEGLPWPTSFTMEGYAGASRPSPNAYLRMDDGELMALRIRFGGGPGGVYAEVQASTRGTECSGGPYNLYDRRHAWDGHHIIEWVAAQPWSNGKVGMSGSSFPGQTAYWVAATQPPSLKAVMPSLLHSDIYRDIFMPGGVQNYLFPSVWTYAAGPHRLPQDSAQNGTLQNDEICAFNQTSRYSAGEPPQPQQEPAWKAIGATDDDWYTGHAAITYAPAIKIPYYQQNNWQDEQTGPRAVVLFNHIHPDPVTIPTCDGGTETIIPKKFALSTGGHGHGGFAGRDRWSMFDIFLRGKCDSTGLFDSQVTNYFESQGNGSHLARKSGPAWPFPDTEWTRLYLRDGGRLDAAKPQGPEGSDSYLSGVARPGYFFYAPEAGAEVRAAGGLPDAASYQTDPLAENTAIAGPIMLDLYASMAGTDADFFVSISEVLADGRVSYIQRGLLKASHNRVDHLRSYYAGSAVSADNPDGMVQPYRGHTNPQPRVPGEAELYRLEVFPVGHVFRAGSRIAIQVTTPPAFDGLWGYTQTHHQPAAVTILHDADHPSALQLPVVETDAPLPAELAPACPVPDGFPCDPPSGLGG